jgi:hypothetical protein
MVATPVQSLSYGPDGTLTPIRRNPTVSPARAICGSEP